MVSGIDFISWLEQTDKMRAAIEAHSASPLPSDASERHAEIEKAIKFEEDATVLVADCEFFLTRETERETMLAEREHPDFKDARVAVHVKARVAGIKRLLVKMKASAGTMSARRFAVMNQNRSSY